MQTTRGDGLEHFLGGLRNEQEKGLAGRLLHHFEEGVGRLHIHFFRKVQHHGAVAALHGTQRQPVQDTAGLVHGDARLLSFYADGAVKFIFVKIRVLQHQLPERGQVLQGNGFIGPGNREHEMDVRVDELVHARIAAVELF